MAKFRPIWSSWLLQTLDKTGMAGQYKHSYITSAKSFCPRLRHMLSSVTKKEKFSQIDTRSLWELEQITSCPCPAGRVKFVGPANARTVKNYHI